VADLLYFTGTMDCGKSTLALQMDHNHAARGRVGRIFTSHDRAGEATLSSRLGLQMKAIEVDPDFDFWQYVVEELTHGGRVDYMVCDEAQFYTPEQVEQLARLADELQVDVFCFGILTDFRARMFPGLRGWSSSRTGWSCSRWRRCAGAANAPRTTRGPSAA
jgi:thymidine kinase